MLLGILTALSVLLALGGCLIWDGFTGLTWLWLAPLVFVCSFLVMVLAGFAFLLWLCSRVDQDVPQEKDDPFYRTVTALILDAALPFLRIRVTTSGMEKVPQDGRFLLVCNHCSDSDPIILLRAFKQFQLAFISKRENKDMFVIGPMMHKLQCQLLNRENDREALKTILKCIQILKEDRASVAVFPEGGILSEDGKLHHFKPGVFKIAQKANVPIVVCTLKNTLEVVHNIYKLKPSRVQLEVLEVVQPADIQGKTTVEVAQYCHGIMARSMGPGMLAQ